MNLTTPRLLALATAALALNACSSEPSDWRPENKVSLDMVAPGTRVSDNFDQHTEYAPNQAKGAAITKPVSSHVDLEGPSNPPANSTISANSEEGQHGEMHDESQSTQQANAEQEHAAE